MVEEALRIQRNERCFIANRECGRLFGGSTSTCFVASPHLDQVGMEISLVKAVLQTERMSDYVAVEQAEYSRDVFCEKICSKIIESRFCVVMLDDKKVDDTLVPNPNVYYEYGLMIAMRKEIIPMQREGIELPFNIQSLDILLYDDSNLGEKLTDAIHRALARTEMEALPSAPAEAVEATDLHKKALTIAELSGLVAVQESARSMFDESRNITARTRFNVVSDDPHPMRYFGTANLDSELNDMLVGMRLVCRCLDARLAQYIDEKEAFEREPADQGLVRTRSGSGMSFSIGPARSRLTDLKKRVEHLQSIPVEFLVACGASITPESIARFKRDFATIEPGMIQKPKLIVWDSEKLAELAREHGIDIL